MRIGYIKLINYLNIYNGLRLHELFIDFTKCKNNIVLIRGLNGSGKSSLIQYLSMMPDSNECFIPRKPARKEISIITPNIIYEATFIHDIKSNGEDRETAKAYVRKCVGGVKTELNPNGNIRSFKDIMGSELGLDANYLALSTLSCEDRGMVDKKPAERKRFINSILSNLEAYNGMHKTLSKRMSNFKSMVNRLIVKIDAIGDEEGLKATLKSISNRLNNYTSEKDKLLSELSESKSTIKFIDPDGSIQERNNMIYASINDINNKISDIEIKISTSLTKLELDKDITPDLIIENFNKLKSTISELSTKNQILENNIQLLLSNRESEVAEIDKKKFRLSSMNVSDNFASIEATMNQLQSKIIEYESILDTIGIDKNNVLSKNEYIEGLNTLKEIKEEIAVINSNIDYNILNKTISKYLLQNRMPELEDINNAILETSKIINTLEMDYVKIKNKAELSEKALLRPTGCKFDDCFFVKDAVDALNSNPKETLSNIDTQLASLRVKLEQLEVDKVEIGKVFECYNAVNRLLRFIQSKSHILLKLPNTDNITNTDILLHRMINRDLFEEIDVLYGYIEYCDVLEDYVSHKQSLLNIEEEYHKYMNKKELINELLSDIDVLNKKLETITTEIEGIRDVIFKNNVEVKRLKALELNYDTLLELTRTKNALDNDKSVLLSQYYNMKANIDRIKTCIANIDRLESAIANIDKDMPELIKDRDELNYDLKMLYEYRAELDMFTEKFEKVKDLKDYSSPSIGIQLLFIRLYMNDMISLVNELLQYVFNGEFHIQLPVVNEKEFRLPCIGEGLPRDDISSLSTSQKSIMSMIVSFALLKQSSTDYNILKLDEIDGGLDEYNRRMFIDILKRLMNLLHVEQCIIVSHNDEIDMNDTDVIVLRNKPDQTFSGNVIYRYAG